MLDCLFIYIFLFNTLFAVDWIAHVCDVTFVYVFIGITQKLREGHESRILVIYGYLS